MSKQFYKTMELTESEEYIFEGVASKYDEADRESDVIVKGAFTNFNETDSVEVPLLYSHDATKPIGKATLIDDGEYIRARAELHKEIPLAKEAYSLIKFGAMKGLSIGFTVKDYEFANGNDPFEGVIIKEAELLEVSVVAIPANQNAGITDVKELNLSESDAQQIANFILNKIELNLADKNKEADKLRKLNLLDKIKL